MAEKGKICSKVTKIGPNAQWGISESGRDLRIKTHVYGVEWHENNKSGVRFYSRGTHGTLRDTLEFSRTPKSRFLPLCTCFHRIISRKFRVRAQISFLRNSGNSAWWCTIVVQARYYILPVKLVVICSVVLFVLPSHTQNGFLSILMYSQSTSSKNSRIQHKNWPAPIRFLLLPSAHLARCAVAHRHSRGLKDGRHWYPLSTQLS
jgi:hypothetical protein